MDFEALSATDFNPELDAEDVTALQQKDVRSIVGFYEFFALDDYMARERALRAQGQVLEGIECSESVGQFAWDEKTTEKCLLSD